MQAHIFIFGFVQGVGYRQFVKKNARELGLSGWVKNLDDGRVEALVVGNKDKIESLIKICEKGPFFSEVKSVQVEWEEKETSFEGFNILRT